MIMRPAMLITVVLLGQSGLAPLGAQQADPPPLPSADEAIRNSDESSIEGTEPDASLNQLQERLDRVERRLDEKETTAAPSDEIIPESPSAEAAPQVQATNPNSWRYRWHDGKWWYWLPSERWVYWSNGAWVRYEPTEYVPPIRYRAYYAPSYYEPSYSYRYRSYPYYGYPYYGGYLGPTIGFGLYFGGGHHGHHHHGHHFHGGHHGHHGHHH
jgi:hypothetical protein